MGILQNQKPTSPAHFSRDEVRKNTKLNTRLGEQGEQVRKQLREAGHHHHCTQQKFPKTKAPSALAEDVRFDEDELSSYDKIRGQHQLIDEPKTPFTGSAETTEYYDNEEIPDPPELELGQAEEP